MATYTPEQVDALIVKFEKAAEKQISKAPDDVEEVEKEFLKPSFTATEHSLMSVVEEIRDVCAKAVLGTKESDRDYLDEVFGRGCNCTRFCRVRDVLGKVKLSKMSANDARWQQVKIKMNAIEEVLRQRGSFVPPSRAPATPPPTSLRYPNSRCYDKGEQILLEPSVDGDVVSYAVEPSLPDGLSLDTATGKISGTPTIVCPSSSYVVTASNASGAASFEICFEVRLPPPKAVEYSLKADIIEIGEKVLWEPSVASESLSYSVEPALPQGLTLDSATGIIQGSPLSASSEQSYLITASNSSGEASVPIHFKIVDPPPTALVYPDLKKKYVVRGGVEAMPEVTGGLCSDFSVEPALPAGISFDAKTGAISGAAEEPVTNTSYVITASNQRGKATFEFVLDIVEPEPDLVTKICACTDVKALLAIDPGPASGETWMVWMVHRVHLNDDSLEELDFSNMEMPPPEKQEKVAPKLMKALLTNTTLQTLKLSNSNFMKSTCMELANAMATNATLKNINIESNDLDADCIKACASKLSENPDTSLETWMFDHQKSTQALGASTEQLLTQLMKDNNTITKLGVGISDANSRDSIDRYIIRNIDRARRLARGRSGTEELVSEVRKLTSLTLMAAPEETSAGQLFEEDEDGIISILHTYCVEKLQVPSKEQLQSYAKNQSKTVPFAKAKTAVTAFIEKLLDAAIGTKVSLIDLSRETLGELRGWSAATETNWVTNVNVDGSIIQYKGDKQPPIKISEDFAAWLRT